MSSFINDRTLENIADRKTDLERFLRFPLNSEIDCLLSLEDLKGVINVKMETILPVPQIPAYWLGIINWRGEAIWILDLVKLLASKQERQKDNIPKIATAMLIEDRLETIGILVEQVSTIEAYNVQNILPISSTMLASELSSFLKGYFLDSKQQPLMVLDLESTLQSALKN